MKRHLAAMILAVSMAAGAQPYTYEPAVSKLTGVLVSATGDSPKGRKITYPALKLHDPITVNGTGAESPTEKGVALMHMALDAEQMASFKALKGRRVEVTGTLFHSDNANHQTNVLVSPTSIQAAK